MFIVFLVFLCRPSVGPPAGHRTDSTSKQQPCSLGTCSALSERMLVLGSICISFLSFCFFLPSSYFVFISSYFGFLYVPWICSWYYLACKWYGMVHLFHRQVVRSPCVLVLPCTLVWFRTCVLPSRRFLSFIVSYYGVDFRQVRKLMW